MSKQLNNYLQNTIDHNKDKNNTHSRNTSNIHIQDQSYRNEWACQDDEHNGAYFPNIKTYNLHEQDKNAFYEYYSNQVPMLGTVLPRFKVKSRYIGNEESPSLQFRTHDIRK